MNEAIAAMIDGPCIALLNRNGSKVGYASVAAMGSDRWVNACVNGNILVGTTERGMVVTWMLRDGSSPSLLSRR